MDLQTFFGYQKLPSKMGDVVSTVHMCAAVTASQELAVSHAKGDGLRYVMSPI